MNHECPSDSLSTIPLVRNGIGPESSARSSFLFVVNDLLWNPTFFHEVPKQKSPGSSFKELPFVAGRANHWDGPQSPALPLGLHPECHQRGTLSHPHITQVQHHSLSIDFSLMDSHFTHRDVWSQHVLTLGRRQQSNQTVHKMSRRYCNYNWLELHFSCKVLFPAWLPGTHWLLACFHEAYWLTYFPTMKRETINICPGVFSLSKTSRSKVSPNFFFCSVGQFWTCYFWVRRKKRLNA